MGRRSYRSPAYQVDFTASANGKTLGLTKRKISFKFGFANPQALEDGCVGVECRGQEHEVVCIWSVTSGKRQVFVDGREVHNSVTSKAQAKFECNFNFMAGHVMKLTAHAAPPMASNNGFIQRQFDLTLDGQSFFEFAKLYELGMKTGGVHSSATQSALVVSQANVNTGEYGSNSFAEEPSYVSPANSRGSIRSVGGYHEYDQMSNAPSFAKTAHEGNTHQRSQVPSVIEQTVEPAREDLEQDLLDLNSEIAAPIPVTVHMPTINPSFISTSIPPNVSPMYMDTSATSSDQYSHGNSYVQDSYQPHTSFQPPSPSHGYDGSYNFQPSQNQGPRLTPYQNFQYQQSSYEIMNKYQIQSNFSTEECTDIVVVPSLSQNRLTMAPVNTFVEEKDDEDLDEISKTLKKICNLDHIQEESKAKQMAKLAEKKEGCVLKDQNGKLRSKGLAPVASLNSGATLEDIAAKKASKTPAQPVMRSPPRQVFHPQVVHAGALVVYGAPQSLQSGPPPLPHNAQRGAYGYTNYAY